MFPARQGLLGATLDWASAIDVTRKTAMFMETLAHALPLPVQLPLSVCQWALAVSPGHVCNEKVCCALAPAASRRASHAFPTLAPALLPIHTHT